MPEVMCRIWLSKPQTSDATQGFNPRPNDVIAIYNAEVGILTLIKYDADGNQDTLALVSPVYADALIQAFANFRDVFRILNNENVIPFKLLDNNEAQVLRDLIINANSNDIRIRNAFIMIVDDEEVEEIVEVQASGEAAEALLDTFFALQASLKYFRARKLGKQETKKLLDEGFAELENQARLIETEYSRDDITGRVEAELQFGAKVMMFFDSLGVTQPTRLKDLSPFEQAMTRKYREYFYEESSIRRAFHRHTGSSGGDDDDDENEDNNEQEELERIATDYIRRITDEDTNREVTIFWAHRSAHNNRDLAASDLIYVTESHRSLVIVQHKKLTSGDLSLDDRDKRQKDQLLSICQRQGAGCSNQMSGTYRQELEMRIMDCPVYYALGPQIDKSMVLPACMVEQILEECHGNPQERKRRLNRSYTGSQFERNVNRTLVGSNSDEFQGLKDTILSTWDTNILTVEKEMA